MALLPVLALPRPAVSLAVADETSGYVRGSIPDSGITINADTAPSVDLGLEWRRATLTFGYAPRLVLGNLYGPRERDLFILHEADASCTFTRDRYEIVLSQSFAYGEQFFGNLPMPRAPDVDDAREAQVVSPMGDVAAGMGGGGDDGGTAPVVSLLPTLDSLRVLSARSAARVRYDWTRRWASTWGASYDVTGGYGPEAEALVPRQHIVGLSSGLSYRVREPHQLSTEVSASRASGSNGIETWITRLDETWTAQWTESTGTWLTAGVSHRRSDVRYRTGWENLTNDVLPTAGAGVRHSSIVEGIAWGARLGTEVSPRINVLLGELQTFSTTNAELMATKNATSVTVSGDVSQTLPADEPGATTAASAGFQITQGLTEWLDLIGGGRIQRQVFRGEGALTLPAQWVVSAGVRIHPPVLNFFEGDPPAR